MKNKKWIVGTLVVIVSLIAIAFALMSEKTLVTHPKGVVARSQLQLITTNVLIMLSIIVPSILILLIVAWKFRADNPKATYDPDRPHSVFHELILWVIPSIFVAIMALITWYATYELDPYRPLESKAKPLNIQVMAMDWKWLFIYPEQGIASINLVQFPAETPISFSLAADSSPMNSFWIPELSGQIYSMTGMITKLHVMADKPGVFRGKAAEINGYGYADMTFLAKASTLAEFEEWVAKAKQSPLQLTKEAYNQLTVPSLNVPVTLYSDVETGLFDYLVMKYMHPHQH